MATYYTTRNKTQNGTPSTVNLSSNRDKVEARCRELESLYPGVEFEIVEMTKKSVTETVYKPGRGRAGNSYASRQTKMVWSEAK